MGDFSIIGGQRFETGGANEAASIGINIAGHASANTKGAWTQLIASTGFEARGIYVFITNAGSSAQQLIDIGIGAEGSEVVKIPNLLQSIRNILYPYVYFFPITIPAGSRISTRLQSSATNQTIKLSVMLAGAGFIASKGLGRVTDYGTVLASSTGIQVDPGDTINTKGAWQEIVASTTNRIRGLMIAIGNNNTNVNANITWLMDVAIGAESSEQIKLSNILLAGQSVGCAMPNVLPFVPIEIPAGTRIAIRCQCSVNTATLRILTVALYGVD